MNLETTKIAIGVAIGVAALALILRLYGPSVNGIGKWVKGLFVKTTSMPTYEEVSKAYAVLKRYCREYERAQTALTEEVWPCLEPEVDGAT